MKRMKRIEISGAAINDAMETLDLHHAGLEQLAKSLELHGLQDGDIQKIINHAAALDGLRKDLVLSAPDDLTD